MHSFEFTHENKSRSACAKYQHKHVTDTVTVTVTDTNKDTQVPSFCHVDIFCEEALALGQGVVSVEDKPHDPCPSSVATITFFPGKICKDF